MHVTQKRRGRLFVGIEKDEVWIKAITGCGTLPKAHLQVPELLLASENVFCFNSRQLKQASPTSSQRDPVHGLCARHCAESSKLRNHME